MNQPNHPVSASCRGEECSMCGEPAAHKVGEEFLLDTAPELPRHNLTAYVCCECFGEIFGLLAQQMCGLEN